MEPPRLLTLVQLLESDGELRQRVQDSLGQMLAELDCLSLFAEAGLPSVHPFTTEIVQRWRPSSSLQPARTPMRASC